MMRKIKILLICIANKNCGDAVIADNTYFLLNKAIPKLKRMRYDIIKYAIGTEDTAQIKYVDAVIFAGGGIIKFRQEKFYSWISKILFETEKYNIPVFFNAVGVEGYDGTDERCNLLKNAMNYRCVKAVSIRDDIKTFTDHYMVNSDTRVEPVFDPAVWSALAYRGRIISKKTGYIGIGIARDKLFSDHGFEEMDRKKLLDLWKETALKLEARGLKWKIFTTGTTADEAFAKDVLAYIGHGEKLPQPKNALELVNHIHSFDSIIACRLHANIIAYSLKIPSIGLVWNDKLKFWGEKTGYQERFIQVGEISANTLVDSLERARKEGCKGPGPFDGHDTLRELKGFVREHCRICERESENIDFKKHLVAPALGGMDFKYKNTNTIEAMETSLAKGYQYFEVDVRLTKDERLVCVNGWSKDTFSKLGLAYGGTSKEGLMYDDFMGLKYHDQFKTVDFSQLLDKIPRYRRVKIILDVGKPRADFTQGMFEKLVCALRASRFDAGRFVVRLQRIEDVNIFKSLGYGCEIAYFLPNPTEDNKDMTKRYKETVDFCKGQGIGLITMTPKAFNADVMGLLKDNDMEACVLAYTKSGDIIDAMKCGALLVGSHYYDPGYMERLTK